ncbi:H-NS histone family protein [Paraburkholderia jirisanensis]
MKELESLKKRRDELHAELASIADQIEAVMADEKVQVIASIRALIDEYRIDPKEIGMRVKRAPHKAAPTRGVLPAKYQDPKSGKTWSGRGRAPEWLANAQP